MVQHNMILVVLFRFHVQGRSSHGRTCQNIWSSHMVLFGSASNKTTKMGMNENSQILEEQIAYFSSLHSWVKVRGPYYYDFQTLHEFMVVGLDREWSHLVNFYKSRKMLF